MTTRSVAKKEAASQQMQQQQQERRDVETEEHHSSANASAGLNLNLLGNLSGALSSKSKKTTHTNPDGSSHSVEDRDDKALASGAAQGQGSAYAAGNTEDHGKKQKMRELGASQSQMQGQSGKAVKGTDHLGIEG